MQGCARNGNFNLEIVDAALSNGVPWPFSFAGMAAQPKKYRKLQDLRAATPHVSKSALESILQYVEKHGLPEHKTAKAMRLANQSVVKGANGHGPLLVHQDVLCNDGSTVKVEFVNLCSFAHFLYKQGGCFYHRMREMLGAHAGKIGLCLYSDEVCPGNPLAANTSRKCWVVYASFKEWGPLLSNENAWMTLCIVRSSVVADLQAGISQIMKKLLALIFLNPWCDVEDMGICLQPPKQYPGEAVRRLTLSLAVVIQDGQAQKMTWSVKGDAGSRFCSLCSNCFSHHDDEDDLHHACHFIKHRDLVQHSSAEMLASWDRMAGRYQNCSAIFGKTGSKQLASHILLKLCWHAKN